jgi:hypothetical protein
MPDLPCNLQQDQQHGRKSLQASPTLHSLVRSSRFTTRSCTFFMPFPAGTVSFNLSKSWDPSPARYFIVAHCSLRLGGTIHVDYVGVDREFPQTLQSLVVRTSPTKKAMSRDGNFAVAPPTRIWPIAGVRCVIVGLCSRIHSASFSC